MALAIGLDAGTTTMSALMLDLATGDVIAQETQEHQAQATPLALQGKGYAELDLARLFEVAVGALQKIAAQAQARRDEICCIGVTGQQHGLALLGADLAPWRSAITWQDRRGTEPAPSSDLSVLETLIAHAGGHAAFDAMGCLPATGYLGTSLYWLKLHHQLPPEGVQGCLIPDALATFLSGAAPRTDATDGGSSGLYDIVAGDWAWNVIEALGLPRRLFPRVSASGERLGGLRSDLAELVGLPAGLPVGVAMGDNQASFVGSVRKPDESILINIGTGGQISAKVDRFARLPEIDTRAFLDDGYLLVGAGLYGGRTYALLRDLFRQIGNAFYGGVGSEALYDRMTALAAAVPAGADGVVCSPLFTGTRSDPTLRGSFTGFSPENMTPGHMVRALLEGMAEGFHAMGERLATVAGERRLLIGAGNALQLNPLLCQILADRFGMPMRLGTQSEAAARGAAIVAAVQAGALPSLAAGMALLQYGSVVEPSPKLG